MSGYILSPASQDDIFDIWSYLATKAGMDLANRVEAEFFASFDLLARNPRLGHRRQDLTNFDVHFYRVFPYKYMVVYRQEQPLQIVGVLHAKRNLKRILLDCGLVQSGNSSFGL